MEQTALTNQVLFRHQHQCSENSDRDCGLDLFAGAGIAPVRHPQQNDEDAWKGSVLHESNPQDHYVGSLVRAAAVCPRFSCISLAERAVMIEVIC
jgi:hypothetical protein